MFCKKYAIPVIAVNIVIASVLAGNSVIIKHSSTTPICGQIFENAFIESDAPNNLVQNIIFAQAMTEVSNVNELTDQQKNSYRTVKRKMNEKLYRIAGTGISI